MPEANERLTCVIESLDGTWQRPFTTRELPDPEAPDSFTRAKIKQILNTHTNRTQERLMMQFMIWAGTRVSETIARAWEDVDLKQGTVTFRRSKVREAYRVTKTRRSTRKVRLLEPA